MKLGGINTHVKDKMHDQFFHQLLLISLFIPVSITRIIERLYIYCNLAEYLSISNFVKSLYFMASHSKNVATA